MITKNFIRESVCIQAVQLSLGRWGFRIWLSRYIEMGFCREIIEKHQMKHEIITSFC